MTDRPQVPPRGEILHASAVAFGSFGILITGPSGSGKSGLAMRLMSLGAGLIGDDRIAVEARDGAVWAACASPAIAGRIEARGIGILAVETIGPRPLRLVVDLGAAADARMPQARQCDVAGLHLPLINGHKVPNLDHALTLIGRGGCMSWTTES